MSEGIQAPTHDERVADRLAELQAERDAAVLALATARDMLQEISGREDWPFFSMAQLTHTIAGMCRHVLADPAAPGLAAEARKRTEDAEFLDWIACADSKQIEDMLKNTVCDDVDALRDYIRCEIERAARESEAAK